MDLYCDKVGFLWNTFCILKRSLKAVKKVSLKEIVGKSILGSLFWPGKASFLKKIVEDFMDK